MPRYIDVDKLFRCISGHSYYHGDAILSRIGVLAEGKGPQKSVIPASDVQEVKHGKWLTKEHLYGYAGIDDCCVERLAREGDCAYCSECRKPAGLNGGAEYVLSNYCPSCGAKMDLEE